MQRTRAFLIVVTALAGLSAVDRASAQPAEAYRAPDFVSQAAAVPDVYKQQPMRLTLEQALALAAKNNLGVVLARESVNVAELGNIVARGAFEPQVSASYGHSRSDALPQTSQEGGAGEVLEFTNDSWRLGASKRFTTGTNVNVDFGNNRSDSNLGTAVQPLNYRSSLSVGVSQPLLRGFSFDLTVPRLSILRAKLATARSVNDYERQLSDLIADTESSYWDVVDALKSYQVQERSLVLARKQRDLVERQIKAGTGAPAERITADASVAATELSLIRAQNRIDSAWDHLRQVLNLPRAEWSRPILPTDTPGFAPWTDTMDNALATASARRPELRQRKLDERNADLNVVAADNSKLPQLDLSLNYELSGQNEAYGEALSQISGVEAPSWSVFLSLTWTPLNRAARASAEIEKANRRIVTAQTRQVELAIYSEVRSAVRTLRSADRELRAAARSRALAIRSLDVEQRKFVDGSSSSFVVAQKVEDVARAELAELAALLGHKKAMVALEKATGQLLERRNIELTVGAGK